jgi:hypothetical protein
MDRLYDETMPKTPVLAKSAYFSSKFVDVNAYREHNQKLYTANIILTDAHWKTLIGLYVLACYLLDPAAKNMAIDQIRRFYYEMSWDCSLEKEIINLNDKHGHMQLIPSTSSNHTPWQADGDGNRSPLAKGERSHRNTPLPLEPEQHR